MNKILRALFVVALIAVLSAIHLTIFNQNINRSYKIGEQNRKLDVLRNTNRFLNYKVAQKESLERIEDIAKNKLNMVYPKDVKYLLITGSSVEAAQ